jgi:restriction endonuclease Mrr
MRRRLENRTSEVRIGYLILESLVDLGGVAQVYEVLELVRKKISLSNVDKDLTSSGQVRWKVTARYARLHLIKEGFLAKCQRGYWSISRKGREWLQEIRELDALLVDL